MSLQDYATRKYDYLALRNVDTTAKAQLGLELFTQVDNGQICVGVQKLAQRWLLEFLTETGSLLAAPDRGCDFMVAVRQGRLRNVLNVRTTFSAADLDIRRNLTNEEYEGMPADERFGSVELTNETILAGFMRLDVKINSAAGTSRAIIVPIATLP
ncbi:hypothetical protein [Sphingorhabdus sp.]|uniref:hypothetical protein n=1 Tax=Sphingorhabdus sp. TaxID=1902408 RepID=UPI00333F6FE0